MGQFFRKEMKNLILKKEELTSVEPIEPTGAVNECEVEKCKEDLKWHCEQAIRNYDPCISCATHFLKLNVERV